MSPTPETGGDIWGLTTLFREIALGAVALLSTIGVLVVRRQNKKMDVMAEDIKECSESHPSGEYMKLFEKSIDSQLDHLKEGQSAIFRILDSRQNRKSDNGQRRRRND